MENDNVRCSYGEDGVTELYTSVGTFSPSKPALDVDTVTVNDASFGTKFSIINFKLAGVWKRQEPGRLRTVLAVVPKSMPVGMGGRLPKLY